MYWTTVKQSINNANSGFKKNIKKAKHGYIITLALQSRGTCYMLAVIQKIRQNVF